MTTDERTAAALESIARSLEKMANPLMVVEGERKPCDHVAYILMLSLRA